jgi:hypothetical protein
MRIWQIAVGTLLIGTLVGVGHALVNYRDPGVEFARFVDGTLAPDTGVAQSDVAILVTEDGTDFDFGTMDRGETEEYAFTFRNDGTRPLSLKITRTTCMCAVGELESESIPPGESREVTMKWTPKKHEIDFRETATLATSDPKRPIVTLSIFGRVLPRVRSVPTNVAFGNVTADASRETQTVIYGYQSDKLEVVETRWQRPELAEFFEIGFHPATTEELEREIDAKAAIVCQLKLKPGLPPGVFLQRALVTLQTDKETTVEIPIHGKIVADVMIVGRGYDEDTRTLRLGHVSQKDGKQAVLVMTAKGPHRNDVRPSIVLTEPEDLIKASFDEPRPLNQGAVIRHMLRIDVPAGSRLANHLGNSDTQKPGRIVISTNHPSVPQIEIEVWFAVAD